MENARRTEKRVNAIVEEILDEDRNNEFNATRSQDCPGGCDQSDKEISRLCKCAVENSPRFSLRVMEAMRSLQRDDEEKDQPLTSTAEEIVDYIRANYRNDGDLYAQVRTALRQVCSQGFVIELLDNEYHLIGPVARMTKRHGCPRVCEGRASRNIDKVRLCRCEQSRRRDRSPRNEEESFGDDATSEILRSTRRSNGRRDTVDYEESSFLCDCEDVPIDRRRRDGAVLTRETRKRGNHASPVASGSSGTTLPVKRTRFDDRQVQLVNEEDNDVITEEDLECICNADVIEVNRDGRPRTDYVENQRNERHRETQRNAEVEDEDEEDSVYRELRQQSPRRRSKKREEELKRWIRRCRRECERRAAR